MSMLQWVQNERKPNLVLFIHGLKGGVDTWAHDNGTSLPGLLSEDKEINELFDIAYFNYFSTFTNTYGVAKSIWNKLWGTKKAPKNLPITEIAQLLKTEFTISLIDYQSIIVVAHSMGGLITKSCILSQLEESNTTPINGFVSLAVPHSGAIKANLASSLVTSNIQISDISVLSDPIDEITRKWMASPLRPNTKYIYGAYDNIVDKKSALSYDATSKNSFAVNEDHISISKPKDKDQTVFKIVKKGIMSLIKTNNSLTIETLENQDEFNSEYFVLKLIIADVHNKITRHAKGYFYNAEFARKIFTSDREKKELEKLYSQIKNIYEEEFENHIANKTTSDQLVSAVHQKISQEDQTYLKTFLNNMDNIHKKGMLHQIANNANDTILWSADTNFEDLLKMKK
jgi:pimeloyl-ACP methyl ester carboxylesterase